MVLCNIFVEMGFHFDEIFEDQLRYKFDIPGWPHLAQLDDDLDTGIPHRRGYKHHASYDELVRSAALGCELCRVFACGSTHFSERQLIAPCSELTYEDVLKAEYDGRTVPSEQQIYLVHREPREHAP